MISVVAWIIMIPVYIALFLYGAIFSDFMPLLAIAILHILGAVVIESRVRGRRYDDDS